MKIKICGIQTREQARWAARAGVDMIGLMFAPSRRRISVDEAIEIAREISGEIELVGVFADAPISDVKEIRDAIGLDYVQLHGEEPREYVEQLASPVIKAFSINDHSLQDMFRYGADYILIDSPPGKYRGGSGKAFDWSRLDHPEVEHDRLVLAGGINEENILAAKIQINPAMVDISSGAETDGVKDKGKIYGLVQKMKGVHADGTNI